MVSETTWKGAVAEAAIALEATRHGIYVLRPTMEGRRYDLVFDVDHRFWRVQCKWAQVRNDVVVLPTRTCRHTPNGYVRTTYNAAEIDLLAAYCGDLDRCYLVPVRDVAGQSMLHLRLAPARNNQVVGVKFAADYEFSGAIAQLGERVTGSHEVAGSSPASSTKQSPLFD